ncbi:SRPBCC family protein [Sporichthya brevicatena]|uniref:SRPBCC family protein n=1 Tax=Sporichthya brevicatena TaxID=171442 RepID=A0ABN1G8M3_9ACTN
MDEVALDRERRIRRALQLLRENTTDKFDDTLTFTAGEHVDPVVAERERELIFGRVPTIVAHSSEIPQPYDFVTLQLPRNKVIVARQPDGGVKTFVNLCRHRGALLEEESFTGCGRARLFSCPYHRWSYNIDGSLRTITRGTTFGDIDKSKQGLIELPTEERHGFIWVVDNANATIDVQNWLGPDMDSILEGYGLADLVAVRAEGFDEPVNWKIMQDAFLDGYHIAYAHPNTAAKHIHTNVMAFEDFGRHCRFIAPRKTIDKWIDVDPPEDESLVPHVTETQFLGPCHTLLKQPDHYQLLTFRPDPVHPDRSYMEMRLMVPPQERTSLTPEKWQRLWDKNWEILLAVLHAEDFPLLRASQTGMGSKDAGTMVMGRNETANQVFHREVRRIMAAADDEIAPPLPAISAGVVAPPVVETPVKS